MLIFAKSVSPVNILVYTFLHFGIHFFIGLYIFNTATDHVHFWHACTLGPGLYSPNVFGDAALINYANLCEFSKNNIKCLMLQPIQFMFLRHIYYSQASATKVHVFRSVLEVKVKGQLTSMSSLLF